LPSANLPDELVGHAVQHRFRVRSSEWPLIQVGPGVLTLNETQKYTWSDFGMRAKKAIDRLIEAHPSAGELRIESVVLRYIDAVEFDYRADDPLGFLREKLKLNVSLPERLFAGTEVDRRPTAVSWQATFPCKDPKGEVHLSFATGQKDGRPAIFWETTVRSSGDATPSLPDAFPAWLDAAHRITDKWFFTLIEGDLHRRFEGE
jgi:uncharacterized protein (TIGR04255 family)